MQTPVYIRASQAQHTPAGKFLGDVYYRTRFLENTLQYEEHSGYPHNGGEHSLSLRLTPSDLSAFLTLVEETFPNHPGAAPFVASVRERFAERYPAMQLM